MKVSSANPNAEKGALDDYDQANANYENFKYTETSKVMQDYERAKRNLDSDEGKRYLKKKNLNYQAMLNKLNRKKEAQIGVINVTKNSNNVNLKKNFFETMKRDGYLSDNKYKELTSYKRLKTMSLDEFKKYASNYANGKRAIESVIADINEGYDMALESMIDDLLCEEPVLPELDALESFTYETEEDMDKWDNFLT